MFSSNKYEMQKKPLSSIHWGWKYPDGGVKISYDIFTPGRVGIAFGSVKKSIITIQEIIDMI